jgi:hypothetical protein
VVPRDSARGFFPSPGEGKRGATFAEVWGRLLVFVDRLGPLDGSDPAADDALEHYVRRLQRLAAGEGPWRIEALRQHRAN